MNLFQKKYNRETFVSFLSDSFLPEDFKIGFNEITLTRNQNFASKAFRLGECKSLGLEVFEIHHTSVNDARVGISKDAFQLLLHHSYCNRALIAFIPSNGNQWRFSLIQIEADFNDVSGRITRGYTNPRRFSFLVGEDALVKTPTQFLIDKGRVRQRTEGKNQLTPLQDLQIRFSIEALTQEFYNKLYNWYLWAKDKRTGVTFPNNTDTQADDRDKLEVKMIRLITRMLFVWFIKQKQLVPDNLFDKEYMSQILRGFDPNAKDEGNYYNAILQNLFFATLNQEKEDRAFVHPVPHGRSESYSIKSLYRDNKKESWFNFPESEKEERVKALFEDIPYLNGGLFECMDKFRLDEDNKLVPATYYDGFSTKDTKLHGNFQYRAFVPNILFFAPEHVETVTIKEASETNEEENQEVAVMGLLELFKQYNFTVEENTTSDKEVSLDPELLGRVFENLLAAYNPETRESARKSTGSFYTPREIVEYMVEEAIIEYLSGECGNNAETIRTLVKGENTTLVDNPEKIISDLKKIKILDPACGSGAFPMGILLKITDIIEKLTPKEQFDRYNTKLEIIKNCIYGIDIQAIAMLICKLRFFISLICDCDKDENKPNMGIIPLPNLETKFVAANTLIPAKVKEYDKDWTQDDNLKILQKELLELRLNIFDLRTHKEKRNNKIADREKCREIENYIKQNAIKSDVVKIATLQKAIAQYEAELPLYQEDYWVDEAVAQQSLFGEEKTLFRHNPNKEKREALQSLIKNAKADIQKEQSKSIKPEFTKAIEEVTHWDPYDQNSVSPFFDEEWMFGIGLKNPLKKGFDIVIGNPPYIKELGNEKVFSPVNNSSFGKKYHAGKMDYWYYFLHKSIELVKENGFITFITSRYWINSVGAKKVIKHVEEKLSFINIVDIGKLKVFDNVAGYHMTYLLKKDPGIEDCLYQKIDDDVTNIIRGKFSSTETIKRSSMFKNGEIVLGSRESFNSSQVLDDVCHVSQGIVEASDKISSRMFKKNPNPRHFIGEGIFVLSDKELEKLNLSNEENSIIEIYEDDGCINKYFIDYNKTRRLIYSDTINRDKIANNPNFVRIKNHLDYMSEYITSSYKPYGLHRARTYSDFTQPKLIGPSMFVSSPFAYDDKNLFVGMSYNIICPKEGTNIFYILGLLNSSFAVKWFYENAKHRGAGVDVGVDKLRTFPIPPDNKEIKERIARLVKQVIEGTKEGRDTIGEEKEIDKLVFQLFGIVNV